MESLKYIGEVIRKIMFQGKDVINSNDLLKNTEVIDMGSLQPIFVNVFVVLGVCILVIILNNIVSKYKRKVS